MEAAPSRQQSCVSAQKHFASALKDEQAASNSKERYSPFDTKDALTRALRATLNAKDFQPGVIVIAAPLGAGKTGRVRQVCHDLVEEKAIRGAVLVDFAKTQPLVNANHHFWSKFGLTSNPHNLHIYDVMPPPAVAGSSARVVIILDNVDFADPDSMLTLCKELMMASAASGHTQFLVVATCKDPVRAQMILNLNGGEKTRALGYGETLVNGNPNTPADSWAHSGLKWKKADCERLVSAFESREKHRLPEAVREKLLDLAAKASTPRFIRDFFVKALTEKLLKSESALLALLDGPCLARAAAAEEAWIQVGTIKDPAASTDHA